MKLSDRDAKPTRPRKRNTDKSTDNMGNLGIEVKMMSGEQKYQIKNLNKTNGEVELCKPGCPPMGFGRIKMEVGSTCCI